MLSLDHLRALLLTLDLGARYWHWLRRRIDVRDVTGVLKGRRFRRRRGTFRGFESPHGRVLIVSQNPLARVRAGTSPASQDCRILAGFPFCRIAHARLTLNA